MPALVKEGTIVQYNLPNDISNYSVFTKLWNRSRVDGKIKQSSLMVNELLTLPVDAPYPE